MKCEEAKRLKALEVKHTRLKKLLAEAELDKAMLKDLAQGCRPPSPAHSSCVGTPGLHRSRTTPLHPALCADDEGALLEDMKRLVKDNPRRGCRHITLLLHREGWCVNYKRVHRLWKQEGFRVPRKHCKKRAVGDSSNACDKRMATAKNDVWTWDFIHDRTADGSQLKCLGILDEYTRECLCLKVERSFKSDDVLEHLSELMAEHGVPRHIRSDNGSEFIAKEMQRWLKKMDIKTLYVEAGAPWQNGYIESFNSCLRDEFLEMDYFYTLAEREYLATSWKEHYNNE